MQPVSKPPNQKNTIGPVLAKRWGRMVHRWQNVGFTVAPTLFCYPIDNSGQPLVGKTCQRWHSIEKTKILVHYQFVKFKKFIFTVFHDKTLPITLLHN